jgi:enoyl-CoA hydratase/carnithine racemase
MRTEHLDGVLVLHLGDGANTVDEPLLRGLEGALDAVEADAGVLGIVTVGDGKAFSQGYDLELFATMGGLELQAFVDRSVELLARVATAPVPTVAALNGHAFGWGAMFAFAHDQRIQRADRGWLCLPEVDLGLQFHPMQLALIQARLSPAAAHESILAGRRWDGAAALEHGLVDAVADEASLLRAALDLALARSGKARGIVRALKEDLLEPVLAKRPSLQ